MYIFFTQHKKEGDKWIDTLHTRKVSFDMSNTNAHTSWCELWQAFYSLDTLICGSEVYEKAV